MSETKIPHWSVSNIFPSIDSAEYAASTELLAKKITNCAKLIDGLGKANSASACADVITTLNDIFEHGGMIRAYLQAFITTDSHNQEALKKYSLFERSFLEVQNMHLHFQVWVGQQSDGELENIIAANDINKDHAFALRNLKEQSRYLMAPELEELSNELALSGANAWSKLQGTLTAQLTAPFEVDGKVEQLPMPALINYRSHPDEGTRKRAYDTEMASWKSVEDTLAAALNGVKGTANTLEKRRGRTDCLHSAIDNARISRKTLNVMIEAMEASLPTFEKYFAHKAKLLGKKQLDWWDLFAPDSKPSDATGGTFNWDQARDFVLQHFNSFSPELGNFAKRAFDENWIDAEQREGKRGGAFCMGVPGKKESRILCNFDGSLDQVGTIAHELGHAYHNECAYMANKTEFQQDTPMTLAETASIMCETIVTEALLKDTTDPKERLNILGNSLTGSSQVIVDIYSRFLFEKDIFEKRAVSELSAEEICESMLAAQKTAYRDGVNHANLNKYAWTWKPHYYYAGLSFYNFPYAFGLLFAKGLYAIYQQKGDAFIQDYKNLLASTGEESAEKLALRFGIDIENRKFWDDSLKIIAQEIDQYTSL